MNFRQPCRQARALARRDPSVWRVPVGWVEGWPFARRKRKEGREDGRRTKILSQGRCYRDSADFTFSQSARWDSNFLDLRPLFPQWYKGMTALRDPTM
jgi:hypothetical protein